MSSPFRVVKKRFLRVWWVLLIISTLTTIIASVAYRLDLFGMVAQELDAYDSGLKYWTGTGKNKAKSKEVVIVAIDNLSMDAINNNETYRKNYRAYPYERSLWARIFQFLEKAGAKAIVFDAVMTEKKTDDDSLLQILNSLKTPVFLGFDIDPYGLRLPLVTAQNRLIKDKTNWADLSVEPTSSLQDKLNKAALALSFPVETKRLQLSKLSTEESDANSDISTKQEMLPHPPMDSLWNIVPGFGLVITESRNSPDAKMRTTRFAYTDGVNSYATLSVAAAADLLAAKSIEISPGKLKIGPREIAINQDGSAGIDYGGKLLDRFDIISLIDVLDASQYLKQINQLSDQQKKELDRLLTSFHGRTVLIGGFAGATMDIKSTPLEMFVPGVVKHAAEIDSLLSGKFIVDAPFYLSIVLAFLVALGAVMVTFVFRSAYLDVIWPIVLYGFFFLVPGYLAVHFKIHLLSSMPSIAGSLASIGVTVYLRLFEDRNRELLRDLFSHAMDPVLVEEMVEQKKLPYTKGEIRELTLLYVGSNLFPAIQADLLTQNSLIFKTINKYINKINQVVMSFGGCVEHYQQGAMMAMFGAPLDEKDHAYMACLAALELIKVTKDLHEELKAKKLPDIELQIGIHTDSMLVGNIGNDKFFEYIPLGLAALQVVEIEKANPLHQTKILISGNTYSKVLSKVLVRSILPSSPSLDIPCYELLYNSEEMISSSDREKIEIYQQAYALYEKGDFLAALRLAIHLHSIDPQDFLTTKLLQACKEKNHS